MAKLWGALHQDLSEVQANPARLAWQGLQMHQEVIGIIQRLANHILCKSSNDNDSILSHL